MAARFTAMKASSSRYTSSCAAGTSARAESIIMDAALCAVSIFVAIQLFVVLLIGS